MNITFFISVVTAIMLFIFTLSTLVAGKNSRTSNIFLALFLLSNCIFLVGFILPEISSPLSIIVYYEHALSLAFGFLFGPSLLLFTNSITNKDYRLSPLEIIHFLPFTITVIIHAFSTSIHDYFYFVFSIHVSAYLVICLLNIRQFGNQLKAYYSSIEKVNFSWLTYVVGAFLIMWSLDFIGHYGFELKLIGQSTKDLLTFSSISINLIFAVVIFYKALREPQFFFSNTESASGKYAGSTLTQQEKKSLLERVQNYYKNEKPFLNASLTIADVSDMVESSVKNISQVINELMHKNFYDYTNSFRIEFAKTQLEDTNNTDKTILEILYDSGFNSKSAFNSAFKKKVGCTPTEYRKAKIELKQQSID